MQAGDALQVQCLAHGTPPLHYTWDKVNGSLSARVAHRAGLLRLSPAAPADAGTYRCLVTNRVGTAEAFVRVAVHGEPIPGLGTIGAQHWVVAVPPGALRALRPAQVIPVLTGTTGAPHPAWVVPLGTTGGLHPTQVILVLLGTTGALRPPWMMQVPLGTSGAPHPCSDDPGTTGALHPFQVMLVKVGTSLAVPWWCR